MPVRPRRILLVRLSHLGDVVHALPVFHALRSAHPDAEIAWAVQPEFADLLEGLPGLARIFRFERRRGARAWLALLSQLRAWGPDWAVDAQGNAKSALVTIGSGAGRRSGMHASDWRERFAARVLTDSAEPVGGEIVHAMERMISLVRHVAPGADSLHFGRPDAGLSEAELDGGRAAFERIFPDRSVPALILHLSAPEDVRSWPTGHFEELARELAELGARVLLLSGPEEEDVGRELERRMSAVPRVRHWTGQRGLRDLAALFTAAGEREARMVCCDSGPMHLAAACGLPVACLSGPQDERRTGPWPIPSRRSDHPVLRSSDPPPCAPCLARRCDHPEGPVCMSGIAPAAVLASVLGEASRPTRSRRPASIEDHPKAVGATTAPRESSSRSRN